MTLSTWADNFFCFSTRAASSSSSILTSADWAVAVCSASRPAAIQISCEVGIRFRAVLRTDLAFSGVSSRARVSHNSTEVGMTSTARVRRIRASSGSSSRLTVSFHSLTELGMNSRADCQLTNQREFMSLPFLSTRFLEAVSLSSEAAFIQILTEVGTC